MHLDPRNVHMSDPDEFERALDGVLQGIEELLPAEEHALRRLLDHAAEPEREELAAAVAAAAKGPPSGRIPRRPGSGGS